MKRIICLVFCLLFAASLFSEETANDEEKRVSGYLSIEYSNIWPLYPQITWYSKFWPDPKVDTNLFINAGGGYYDAYYYRNTDQSIIGVSDADYIEKAAFRNMTFNGSIGLAHGLLYKPEIQSNIFELFGLYRIIYRCNFEDQSPDASLIFDSSLPDSEQILLSTFVTGLFLNTWTWDQFTNTRDGWFGQLSFEYAPKELNPTGGSDFIRFDFLLYNYLPLIKNTIFSLYLAQRLGVDVIFGDAVPNLVSASFGGRVTGLGYDGIPGLGGVVRGVDSFKYDGYLKSVYNIDLRANFPSVISYYIIPGLTIFADIGYYDNMDYVLTEQNIIFSAGGGPTLHLDTKAFADFSLTLDLNALVMYNFYEESVKWYLGVYYFY